MSDTDRIVVWLREALDAAQRDAEAATAATGGPRWHGSDSGLYSDDGANHPGPFLADSYGYTEPPIVAHIARHDPASVLRRIAADRKTLAEHEPPGDDYYGDRKCLCCGGYTIHPGWGAVGYRDSWPCTTVRNMAEGYGWTEETTP